jgi:hypothetical protein
MNEIEKYAAEHGSTPLYDKAKRALAECLAWIRSAELDEQLSRMPREEALQFLAQIANDRTLESDALAVRARAELADLSAILRSRRSIKPKPPIDRRF